MFRKNLLTSALTAATVLFSTTSVTAHLNYMHDRWRDSLDSTRISDLYIGLQGAYVQSNWDDVRKAYDGRAAIVEIPDGTIAVVDKLKSKFDEAIFGGRAFVRWDFSQYFGIEGGVSYVDGSEYAFTNWGAPAPVLDQAGMPVLDDMMVPVVIPTGGTVIKDKGTTVIFDLTWVTRVPLQNNFNFYTKFGADFMWEKNGIKAKTIDVANPLLPGVLNIQGCDQSNVSFTFGAGVNYKFSNCWTGDLSWQYFRGNDDVGNFMPDLNLFMVGIAYHINLACCPRNCLGEI